MKFDRMLERFAWHLRTDAEFQQLGWRRGTFLQAYYHGRIRDNLPGRDAAVVQHFVVRHGLSGKKASLHIRLSPGPWDLLTLLGIWVHQDYFHPMISHCRTILDVGAHVGMAAVWFEGLLPGVRLACVEPDARNIPLLRKNLAENGIDARIFECAVAPHTGRLRLGIGMDTEPAAMEGTEEHTYTEFIEVEARSIPDILDTLDWPRVDLLKLDIEGLERDIIADASDWLSQVGMILFEVHHNITPTEIADLFRPYDWILERIGHREEETYLAHPIQVRT
jgi:FkbM family methyltransferase